MQPENHLTPAHAAPATRRTPQPLTAVAFAFGPKHRKYSQKSPAVLSQCRKLAAYLHALGHCGYRLDALCPAGSSAAPAAPGEEWRRLHALLKDAVREAAENPEGPANVAFFKTPHGVKSALRAVILIRGREPGSTYEFVVVLAEGSLPLEAILHVLAQAQPLKAITGGTVKLKLLRGVRRLFRKHPTITHQLETAETLKGREVETDAPFTALALAGPHPADLRHHQTTPHPAEPLLFLAGAELGACSARLNANTAGSPVATADTHYRRPRAYLAAKVPELLLRTKGMAERLKSLPPPADQIDRPLTAERLLAELPRRFSSLAGAAGRKCARASVLTAAVLTSVLLSGCGAMIGLDAKDDFSCPAAEGVPCRSLSTVYELTKSDALPHQVHPVDFAAPVLEGPQGRTARPESVEPPAKAPVKADTPVGSGAGTTNAVSETLQPAGTAQNLAAASPAAEDGAAAPHSEARAPSAPNSAPRRSGPEAVVFDPRTASTADFASPVRLPEKIRRVLLAPWTDDEGDLHEGHFLYLEIRRAHWLTARRPAADAPAVTQLSFGPVSDARESHAGASRPRTGAPDASGTGAAAPQATQTQQPPATGFTSAEELRRLRAEHEAQIRAALPAAGVK